MANETPQAKTGTVLDARAIRDTLRGGRADALWLETWLPKTYENPETLLEPLYGYHVAETPGLKSRFRTAYDLYHDAVVVHLGQRRPAFVAWGGSDDNDLSYDALHQRCAGLAAAWRRAGAEAGQCVCIVLPVSPSFAVAVLTALWLGLVVSTLEPKGPTFVRNRLGWIGADWVATSDILRHDLGLPSSGSLPIAAPQSLGTSASHSYSPTEPCLRLLSPFDPPGSPPVVLPAGQLHESLLRDALLVLGLGGKDVLAAPGFEMAQFQPVLLLCALLAGAAYAEIRLSDVLQDLGVLERLGVSTLGVGAPLRDALLTVGPGPLKPTVRAWFHSLTAAMDPARWQAFTDLSSRNNIAGFSCVMNAATGGVTLFSPRSLAAAQPLRAWPAPGCRFQVTAVSADVLEAVDDRGVLTPLTEEAPQPGAPRVVIGRADHGYHLGGVASVARNGHLYPEGEVVAIVRALPRVRFASVVILPGRLLNDAAAVLLVFVEDLPTPGSAESAILGVPVIVRRIAAELGHDVVPDRVEILPLCPRVVNGAIDHGWCSRQYQSGALTRKARSETFVLLSKLRYLALGGAAAE